ncbi:protein rhomboid-like [Copidosoma floridanum]|uniref:protein rhomboid-like n=1 Tax=Copidosoma floridanum TaxID=29053 RepID=UPI0006C9BA56|nr:protein rhomboid-like [Copidosoma floridanum]XP_014211096.1 protein rhomboid-like [Copidosoma floridanum]
MNIPRRMLRQISEISFIGNFYLIKMPVEHQDSEAAIELPLQFRNDDYWRGIFEKYDADGDGKINFQELREVIRGSGHQNYQHDIPSRVVKYVMQKADLDHSGYLEYPEFVAMIHRKDLQGVFGSYANRYITTLIPSRPCGQSRTLQGQRSRDFTDGIYEEQYTCNPPALAMIIISLIEIMLFISDVFFNAQGTPPVKGPTATLFIYNPTKRYQAWRYITYMFVHVGNFHLVVNLLVQVMLGIPLEMVHKWWRVLIIYFAGVLAGSLGTSISDPGVYLAGASGGVYALITAHVATIVMNWSQMEFAALQLLVFLIVTSVDVGQAIYQRYFFNDANSQIGYVAHLAGAIAGLLVGINILRNLEVQTWEKVVWWLSLFTYVSLMAAAILWNVLAPHYFPTPDYD